MSTTKLTKKRLTQGNSRLSNKNIYLIYNEVIKDHDDFIKYLGKIVTSGIKKYIVLDVENCDDISERHTVVLLEFTNPLITRAGIEFFIYDEKVPIVCTITSTKAKLILTIILASRGHIEKEKVTELGYMSEPAKAPREEKEPKKPTRIPTEIPLAIYEYMDQYPPVQLKPTVYSSGNKPLKMRIDAILPSLNEILSTEYIFLTACLLPTQVTPPCSWELKSYIEQQIVQPSKYILLKIKRNLLRMSMNHPQKRKRLLKRVPKS